MMAVGQLDWLAPVPGLHWQCSIVGLLRMMPLVVGLLLQFMHELPK
jgi:hypothetical protein